METINQIIIFVRILIPVAGAARIVYCILVMSADEEAAESYKKRIRNILIFVILSECITGLLHMVAGYYGG